MENKQISGLMVIFGASGDLAERFIYPALHQLYVRDKLAEKFAIIGAARSNFSEKEFQDYVKQAVEKGPNFTEFDDGFLKLCSYEVVDSMQAADFETLKETINEVVKEKQLDNNFLYFYSISPNLYDETTTHLKASGMLEIEGNHKVIVEKPFGENLASAKEYNKLLLKAFEEENIYYNDHFPAMDFAQNILATRYFNPIIDAIWNKNFVENVQISLPESLSIEDRGGFYDDYGAVLDMFQNHILQLLAIVAMDLPKSLEAVDVHKEKLKALKSVADFDKKMVKDKVVRGQYQADQSGEYNNYRDEEDVSTDSNTDTYFAAELAVNSDRWQGVPFYVRTGKALVENHFTIDLVLKNRGDVEGNVANRLTFELEPKRGLSFVLDQKQATNEFAALTSFFGPDDKNYQTAYIPDPYENLLEDALKGEAVLFPTFPEIKEQWRIADSIVNAWQELPEPDFPNYRAKSFGPAEAEQLVKQNGHEWIYRSELPTA
ncbi:glucose-6-phosphate dehydrogenase [Fundicoccus sp. Sow4_D5]|uniref:glucose-6-phosphate dehydrogenase n=1 Tax=Fundicoccus sp. Sow4_D5 TaxID=3438782 RepID=UPI003F90B2A8